ncbi:MAG: primosomal protein N', partial [Gimesia chilikensis]
MFSAKMLKLTRWIADRYLCWWGQVLDGVVTAGVKNQAGTRMVTVFELTDPRALQGRNIPEEIERLPAKQRAVYDALKSADQPLTMDQVMAAAGCGSGPVQTLKKKTLIRSHQKRVQHFENGDDEAYAHITKQDDLQLNRDQRMALDQI